MELVAQIFAMTMVGAILICMAWTIASYIVESKRKY